MCGVGADALRRTPRRSDGRCSHRGADGRLSGGYISDLETGDVFEPVEYELTAFMCSEYAHGVEENWEWFHSAATPTGRQMRPPTMIHVDKMRILEKNCAKEQRVAGAKGPDAFKR